MSEDVKKFRPIIGREFAKAMEQAGIALPAKLMSVTIRADPDKPVTITFECFADQQQIEDVLRFAWHPEDVNNISEAVADRRLEGRHS